MKALYKIWMNASVLQKAIIVVVLLLLVYFIYKAISKAILNKGTNTLSATANDLQTLASQGEKPNYSDSQFAAWADSLETAMSGLGTDEEQIGSVFKYMQNKADVLKLIKSFGTRDYTDDRILLWNTKQLNLDQWLTTELDPSDLDAYVNAPLKAKGIDYTF